MNFVEEEENEAHVASSADLLRQILEEISARLVNLETRMGNLETRMGKVEEAVDFLGQHLMVHPELRAKRRRENALRAEYKPLFDAAAVGEWVELPAPLQPGDHVKVVGVPDGHPYKDQVGTWRGPGRKILGFFGNDALEPQRFKKSLLRVVVRKWSNDD
jgi:hypothetical protein